MKRNFTVLVVERSDVVRRLTKRVLKKEGLHVLEAPDAATALAVLFKPEHHVDLVIIGEIGSPERERGLGTTPASSSQSRILGGWSDN